ncbi:10430_t:CDS:2, partial [Racocetra fulgida]
KRTRTDEVPEGEKKGVIICRYCLQSFTRRNCYRNHLTKHNDIIYVEENQLQVLLKETEVLTDTQHVREQTPLSSIFCNDINEANGDNNRTSKTSENNKIITLKHVQQDWNDTETFETDKLWQINSEENSSITIIDMRSAQRLYATTAYRPPTFPHLAYAQFMEIVMKYNLPNSVGNELIGWFNQYKMDLHVVLPTNMKQGRTLLDSINIPHILYTKTVIKYNGTEYSS